MVRKSRTHRKLGEMLVEVGIITGEQLQEALDEQKKSGGKLGQNLMALGYITEEIMSAFVGKQLGISYISLDEYENIPPDVIKSVPEDIARHQTLIPIAREENVLTVTMADPLNVFITDDLRVITGCEIKVVISSEAEIKAAIEKYYRPKNSMESMEDVLKTMEQQETVGSLEIIETDKEDIDLAAAEAAGEGAPVVKIVNLILTGAIKSANEE